MSSHSSIKVVVTYHLRFLVTHLLVVTLLLVNNVVVQSALHMHIAPKRKCLGDTGEKKKSTKSKHFTGESLPT